MKNPLKIAATVISAGALMSVVLTSCTDGKSGTAKIVKKNSAVPVKIIELESAVQQATVKTSGKITTDNETFLAFKSGGVIDKIYVQEGDAVKKGQLLATLDPREINAIVSQTRLGYEKSLRDFGRVEKLYKDSVVTLEQLQNARTALDVANEQLQSAEFNKQYSKITAQQDGFVLKKFANPGQVVGVGDPILLTNSPEKDNWILKVNASDKQWSSIHVNDKAKVKLDAFPGEVFEAKVIRKGETSDPATGTFSIDLQVKNGKSTFASGMFASAEITTNNKSAVWQIPYEALLDANGNDGFVFVTSDYKTAIKQSVTISAIEQDRVTISSGFEDHSALIVSGSAYLTDKTAITVIK
ncbi:MAG TPA: efflux RND transporter periplasmic adaptor subunit [Chryseosolibacter sp.]